MKTKRPKYLLKEIEQNKIESEVDALDRCNRINKLKPIQIIHKLTNGEISTEDISKIYVNNNFNFYIDVKNYFIQSIKHSEKIEIIKCIVKTFPNFNQIKSPYKLVEYIVRNKEFAIRDIQKIKVIKKMDVVENILSFLYCKYSVPKFFFNSFDTLISGSTEDENREEQKFSILPYIGQGGSFKKGSIGAKWLNQKEYHALFSTPMDFDWNKASNRAKLISMGGDDRLFEVLSNTRIYSIGYEKGRNDLISFFIKYNSIDPHKIGEIVDYFINRGLYLNPFDFKGRTPNSIIRISDEWHKNIQYSKSKGEWDGFDILDKETDDYKIVQLKSCKELNREGKLMHHCVSTYSSSCIDKRCAIFSLRDPYNLSLYTIEVSNDQFIRQIRGKYNSRVDRKNYEIISTWAKENNLKITKYA